MILWSYLYLPHEVNKHGTFEQRPSMIHHAARLFQPCTLIAIPAVITRRAMASIPHAKMTAQATFPASGSGSGQRGHWHRSMQVDGWRASPLACGRQELDAESSSRASLMVNSFWRFRHPIPCRPRGDLRHQQSLLRAMTPGE